MRNSRPAWEYKSTGCTPLRVPWPGAQGGQERKKGKAGRMHRFWGGDDDHVYTELVNPYFISLEKSKSRVCPTCCRLTYLEPSAHSPNVVMERCPECGALGALVAPEWAKMDEPTQGASQQSAGAAARKDASTTARKGTTAAGQQGKGAAARSATGKKKSAASKQDGMAKRPTAKKPAQQGPAEILQFKPRA